jgi:hypothetical protein
MKTLSLFRRALFPTGLAGAEPPPSASLEQTALPGGWPPGRQ